MSIVHLLQSRHKRLRIPERKVVAFLDGSQAKVNSLGELQSASGEELRRRRMLMPSTLDRAFKGEL
jgi:hypothetical protein